MAAPDQQQTAAPKSQQPGLRFTSNDVVGAIRQMLMELAAIINQPVHAIDPVLMNAYLLRMLEFTDALPRPQGNENGEGRAN